MHTEPSCRRALGVGGLGLGGLGLGGLGLDGQAQVRHI